MPILSPSLVLAVLVGVFWAAAAVAVRVTSGARVPFVFLLAVTGAWAGDAIGGRIGGLFDAARIGDFRIVPASIGAICGILLVVVIAILAPAPGDENLEPDDSTNRARRDDAGRPRLDRACRRRRRHGQRAAPGPERPRCPARPGQR